MHIASVKLAGSKIFINNGILIVLQKIGIFKVRMFCIQCNLKVCLICGYIQLGYEYLSMSICMLGTKQHFVKNNAFTLFWLQYLSIC